MNNPIIVILSSEKLNGENFVKWKSNMNIVLICLNYKFVLTEECPLEPTVSAPRTVREAYGHWIQANNKARCYMLATMSNVIRINCDKMKTAYEIMESLQTMFGQPSDQSHHDIFKAAMDATMKAITLMRENVLKMTNWLNKPEIHMVQ